jgi:hypothetical protein
VFPKVFPPCYTPQNHKKSIYWPVELTISQELAAAAGGTSSAACQTGRPRSRVSRTSFPTPTDAPRQARHCITMRQKAVRGGVHHPVIHSTTRCLVPGAAPAPRARSAAMPRPPLSAHRRDQRQDAPAIPVASDFLPFLPDHPLPDRYGPAIRIIMLWVISCLLAAGQACAGRTACRHIAGRETWPVGR